MFRVRIVIIAIGFMFLLLGLGVMNLQVFRGRIFKELSNKNCVRLVPQEGARGRILDRNGDIIAGSRLSYDVMVWTQGLSSTEQSLSRVSRILGISIGDLRREFKKNYISPSLPVVIAKNIDIKKAILLGEMKLEVPEVIIQPNPVRNYPYGGLASHVIGYLGEIDSWRLAKLEDYGYKVKDIVGYGGIEEKYDSYLRQEEGGVSIEVDHRGRFMRALGFRPSKNGKDIQLTLNAGIQKIVEENLADRKGCVVIMDPNSGEVLAMASRPAFNPSIFVDKTDSSVSGLFSDADAPLINRAISSSYPAGSIFKVIVSAAALETKKINLSTSFLCQGGTLIGKQKFACWSTHGDQSLISAIAHSCNVFFYKTGLLLGAQTVYDYASKFGLSKVTSFDIPYETAGFVPSPLWRKINKFKNWYDGDTANLSIGQGDVLVTPLQMARMMAVFANKGYLVTPYIVKAVDGREISSSQRRVDKVGFRESTLDYVRKGLREVVADAGGTGNALSGLPVAVAGKTGTAQAPPGVAHAWFVGFFPFKEPKFVICVFLERGAAGHYSAVLARQIIEQMNKEGLF